MSKNKQTHATYYSFFQASDRVHLMAAWFDDDLTGARCFCSIDEEPFNQVEGDGAPPLSLAQLAPGGQWEAKAMNTQITIAIRNVYGELKAYPVCDQSRLLALVAGTKALTRTALCLAERMGFEIVNGTVNSDWRRDL